MPIKHIADDLHSMPAVAKTPNDKWMVCQNLDNQLTVYSAQDRFKLNREVLQGPRRRRLRVPAWRLPDGNYVMSGDCDGRLWFWDWKSTKVFRNMPDQVCISVIWHHRAVEVATCSWDGTIKYWD